MTYHLVCDSSCDLREAELQNGRIYLKIVPMRISVGTEDWMDDDTLNVGELLDAMKEEKAASSSACPSPSSFARAFEEADCSICFTISSNLSGTYNAAVLARELVLEEHPEKKICIIDSRSTSGAMVLLVRRAKALLESSDEPDFEAICNELRIYQASLRTLFTLECYDNLIKNGRMRPLVGSLLHSLGIHIVADGTPQGTIHVSAKVRGEQKTYREIIQLMRSSKDCTGAEVVLAHCENLTGAMRLKEAILAELPVKDVSIIACRGLTTFYAMRKGLIIGY